MSENIRYEELKNLIIKEIDDNLLISLTKELKSQIEV